MKRSKGGKFSKLCLQNENGNKTSSEPITQISKFFAKVTSDESSDSQDTHLPIIINLTSDLPPEYLDRFGDEPSTSTAKKTFEATTKKITKLKKPKKEPDTLISTFFQRDSNNDDSEDFSSPKKKIRINKPAPIESKKTNKTTRTKRNQTTTKGGSKKKKISDEDIFSKAVSLHCARENVDPDELKLALALSRSMVEVQGTDDVTGQTCDNIHTLSQEFQNFDENSSSSSQEKQLMIHNAFKKFGFKKNGNCEYDINDFFDIHNIKSKHKWNRKITALTRRNSAVQLKKFNQKVKEILGVNGTMNVQHDYNTNCDNNEPYEINSDILQQWITSENILFNINSADETVLIHKYYTNDLFEISNVNYGYLLKDWALIPGRDVSPSRNTDFNTLESQQQVNDQIDTTSPNSHINSFLIAEKEVGTRMEKNNSKSSDETYTGHISPITSWEASPQPNPFQKETSPDMFADDTDSFHSTHIEELEGTDIPNDISNKTALSKSVGIECRNINLPCDFDSTPEAIPLSSDELIINSGSTQDFIFNEMNTNENEKQSAIFEIVSSNDSNVISVELSSDEIGPGILWNSPKMTAQEIEEERLINKYIAKSQKGILLYENYSDDSEVKKKKRAAKKKAEEARKNKAPSEEPVASTAISSIEELMELPSTEESVVQELMELPSTDESPVQELMEIRSTDESPVQEIMELPSTDESPVQELMELPSTEEVAQLSEVDTNKIYDEDVLDLPNSVNNDERCDLGPINVGQKQNEATLIEISDDSMEGKSNTQASPDIQRNLSYENLQNYSLSQRLEFYKNSSDPVDDFELFNNFHADNRTDDVAIVSQDSIVISDDEINYSMNYSKRLNTLHKTKSKLNLSNDDTNSTNGEELCESFLSLPDEQLETNLHEIFDDNFDNNSQSQCPNGDNNEWINQSIKEICQKDFLANTSLRCGNIGVESPRTDPKLKRTKSDLLYTNNNSYKELLNDTFLDAENLEIVLSNAVMANDPSKIGGGSLRRTTSELYSGSTVRKSEMFNVFLGEPIIEETHTKAKQNIQTNVKEINYDDSFDEFDELVYGKRTTPAHSSQTNTTDVFDNNYSPVSSKIRPLSPPSTDFVLTHENQKYHVQTGTNVSPKPNYEQMDTPTRLKHLHKYGLKPLAKRKAIICLEHIYNRMHPFVEILETDRTDEDGYFDFKKSKIIKSPQKNSLPLFTSSPMENLALHEPINNRIAEKFKWVLKLEKPKIILPSLPRSKKPWCLQPLHIAWYNLICTNSKLYEQMLFYKPIDLNEIRQSFKKIGLLYDNNDLIGFFDQYCITFRTENKRNKNASQKKSSK